MTATGGTFYVWSNGETTNWITVSPSATTEYSVTVTDGNGCQATAAYSDCPSTTNSEYSR
ncbi:MAG: hypothetical protein U0T36_00070 [Saprospiraceae bacterium]